MVLLHQHLRIDDCALSSPSDRIAISGIENQERYLMDYEIVASAKRLKVSVASLLGVEFSLIAFVLWIRLLVFEI